MELGAQANPTLTCGVSGSVPPRTEHVVTEHFAKQVTEVTRLAIPGKKTANSFSAAGKLSP